MSHSRDTRRKAIRNYKINHYKPFEIDGVQYIFSKENNIWKIKKYINNN